MCFDRRRHRRSRYLLHLLQFCGKRKICSCDNFVLLCDIFSTISHPRHIAWWHDRGGETFTRMFFGEFSGKIVSTNYQAFVWGLSLESNIRLMYRRGRETSFRERNDKQFAESDDRKVSCWFCWSRVTSWSESHIRFYEFFVYKWAQKILKSEEVLR